MKHIYSVLLPLCKDLGLEEKMLLMQIETEWRTIFSEPLSLHTWPSDLKDGELLINVDTPAWLQQLKFLQPMIIQKLSAYQIRSVRLRLGKVRKKGLKKESVEGLNSLKKPFSGISDRNIEGLNAVLSVIMDAETREIIKNAIRKSPINIYHPGTDKKKNS